MRRCCHGRSGRRVKRLAFGLLVFVGACLQAIARVAGQQNIRLQAGSHKVGALVVRHGLCVVGLCGRLRASDRPRGRAAKHSPASSLPQGGCFGCGAWPLCCWLVREVACKRSPAWPGSKTFACKQPPTRWVLWLWGMAFVLLACAGGCLQAIARVAGQQNIRLQAASHKVGALVVGHGLCVVGLCGSLLASDRQLGWRLNSVVDKPLKHGLIIFRHQGEQLRGGVAKMLGSI